MTNVVLTAGRATRMGGVCKALHEVDGRPMIEHQLDVLGTAVVVCQSKHQDQLAKYGPTVVDDSVGGPAAALARFFRSYNCNSPVTVVYADTFFSSLPDGDSWCGVWHTREDRPFDVVVDGIVVSTYPRGWEDTVCVGAYRFGDPWRACWETANLSGRLRVAGLAGVVNACHLPFRHVPSWRNVGAEGFE